MGSVTRVVRSYLVTVKELIDMLKLFKPDMVISIGYDQYGKTNGRKITMKPGENMHNVLEIRGYSDPKEYMDNEQAIRMITAYLTVTDNTIELNKLPREIRIARDLIGQDVFSKILEEEKTIIK